MKNIFYKIITLIALIIDLYVMVTAELAISLLAFVIGLFFLFQYVFEFQSKYMNKESIKKRTQKKNWIQGGIQFFLFEILIIR